MFGERWRFGIECELHDRELDPWGSREPYGSLWLWIGGHVIGNPDRAEQLHQAFSPFKSVTDCIGRKAASTVPGTSYLDKFDFITWVRFGEDEEFATETWGAGEIEQLRGFAVAPFVIFPGGFSPFQDGWDAVLLEDEQCETLVWRCWCGETAETHEVSFPLGELTRVTALALEWFLPFQPSRFPEVQPS